MKFRSLIFSVVVTLLLTSQGLRSQVSVVGQLSHDRVARPGESYEGTIIVRNDSEEPQEAKIYQSDYSFHFSGSNSYGEPGLHPRSNARWVLFSPSFLTLPPRSTAVVNYVVSIPDSVGPQLSGTYWSMIMVEGIRRGSAASGSSTDDKKEMGIAQTIRYGIQVATTVEGTGSYNVRFVGAELQKEEDGTPVLQVDIENNGEKAMKPSVTVEVFDMSGLSKGKFQGASLRMYPGTSVREVIRLSGLSKGSYKAVVAVDPGGDDIFAAEYTLEL